MIWSCHEITHLAADFLERRLAIRRRWAVRMHLAMCRGCRAYVHQLRLTFIALRALPPGDLVPDQRHRLLKAFEEHYKPD
ncbi:MAG: zf-HC2 domain-containing protein [Candidatus Eisenbacteria bacterium]